MATFLKDVLYPGSYSVPDGKGGRRKVTYSRQQVQHLGQRLKDMLAAGLQIPLAAEHQSKAKPLTAEERKADWVKALTMGWAEDAELAPEGFLTTKVAVPVAKDAERLPAARFVSPEIVEDFVDGTGRLWPGPSITHLAVTPQPVQHHQKPFQPVQMSVVRLSLADYEGEKMADEPEEMEEGSEEETPEATPEKPAESGPAFNLGALRGVLAEDGYAVPDHITEPGEFLKHLHTAALSKKAMIDKLLAEEGADETNNNPAAPPGEPEPAPASGPITMSLAGHKFALQPAGKKKGKPVTKSATQLSLDGSDNPFAKRLLKKERESIQGRIATLFQSGRITKPIHDKLQQAAGTVQLSLDTAGELATNAVLSKVEAYEELGEGAAWANSGTLPEGVQAAAPNPQWGNGQTPEGVGQAVDDFFSMLPGAKQK